MILAGHLGRTKRELLESIDSHELTEWWEFYQRFPFGMEWDQAGEICAAVSAGKLKKEGGEPFGPVDFMPFKVKRKQRPQSEKEMEARLHQALLSVPKKKPEPKKKKK